MSERYGVVKHPNGYSFEGYTMHHLEEEIIPAWEANAEVGEDLGDITGDLAIGFTLVKDLIARIKELEAKIGTEDT